MKVYYDEELNPIMAVGCQGDFSLIRRFCKDVLGDESVFGVFIQDIEEKDDSVSCDCDYLLSIDADYIITDNEWLPLNPN